MGGGILLLLSLLSASRPLPFEEHGQSGRHCMASCCQPGCHIRQSADSRRWGSWWSTRSQASFSWEGTHHDSLQRRQFGWAACVQRMALVPPGHRCKSKTDHGVLLGYFLLPLHFWLMTQATYSNSQALWSKGSVVQSGHQRSGTWGLESIGINGCHRGRS